MNILVLSWRGPGHPNFGGAEIVTHEHAKTWVKAGHQVTLFTSIFKRGKTTETLDGVRVVRQGYAEWGVKLAACWWYLFGDHPKIDLVVDHFHGIPFFTPLYVRVKKLAFIHETAREIWFLNYIWPKAMLGYLLEPWVFRLLYRQIPFICVSESTASSLVDFDIPKENIHIIHNGVSVIKVLGGKMSKKTLLFLGALSTDKGVDKALEVFNMLNKRFKQLNFWVVGKGSPGWVTFLKRRSREYQLSVKFFGFVGQKKKFELLKRAHLVINPSIREGWGLVVIEAAAMGTPTIGFDVAGLKDSIRQNITGVLVKPGDIQGMTDETEKLLLDNRGLQKMAINAVKWSKQFNWVSSTKKSLHLIESIYEKK